MTAKTTPPRLSSCYPRQRLFRLLDKFHNRPIVWISGPPGAGKTTLAASFLQFKRLRCLWYRLDEGDSDVASFFHSMSAAVRQTSGRRYPVLPSFTPENFPVLSTFSRQYFRTLFGCLRAPSLLVLDQHEQVDSHSDFHRVMRDGLPEIPAGIQVILISRNAPPPELARLEASGAMARIGWKDLRLSRAETEAIFGWKRRNRFSKTEMRRIHQMAGGWMTGLILLMQNDPSVRLVGRLSDQESPQLIFDYFASEIFEKLDRTTQNMLLKTSCLPWMSAAMAAGISGSRHAGLILDDLCRKHLFTVRRVLSDKPLYEYHGLFRMFLMDRASQVLTPHRLHRLQRRSAALFFEAGHVEEAAKLYINAKDWSSLTRIVCDQSGRLLARGQYRSVESWLSAIPSSHRDRNPYLLFWSGVCRIPFQQDESLTCFCKAYKGFKARKDRNGMLITAAGAMHAIQIESRNLSLLDPWLTAFDRLQKKNPGEISGDMEGQVIPTLFFALVFRQPDHPEFEHWRTRTSLLMKNSSDMGVRVQSAFALITDYNWRGDFPGSEAVLHLFRALSGGNPPALPPLAMVMLRVAEATFLMLAGRFTEGFQAVSDGLKISQESGIPIWDSHLLGFGAMGALSTGDLRTAERYLKQMSRNLSPGRNFDLSLYYGLSAWQSLLTGDVSQALSHAGLSHAAAKELGATLPEACSHLLLTQILHETGETVRAQAHIQDGLRIAHRMGSAMMAYMGLIAEAQLALDRGDEISGVNALRSALTLGRQHGIYNFFFWRPGVMTRLCAKALEHQIETGYVHDLIRRRDLIPSALQTEVETWPRPLKIYTLGRFSLLLNGNPLRFTGKTPQKPLALLKAMIALGGRQIREAQLNDLLWPDAEADNAHKTFSVTLTRLRQRLGLDPAISLSNGSVSLDPTRCWVDIWAFERLLTNAASKPSELEKAMQLYKGPFLWGENDPWVIAVRDRLRARFLTCVHALTRFYRDEQQWEKAVDTYQNALKAEEEAESLYQGLIQCHLHLGAHSEALRTYRRCEKILAARLGIPPSPQTKTLVQPILSSPLR